MPKYAEGETHQSKTGQWYVVGGGKWQPMAMGQQPRPDYGRGSFQTKEGDIAQPGVHGQTVILRKSTRDDEKRVAEAQTNAHNLAIASQASQDFMNHYAKLHFPTGMHYDIPGVEPLARNTVDPELGAMESINARIAPQLRPVGTGRLQQQELQKFYKSLPSVGDSHDANSAKTAQIQSEAMRASHYAAFLSHYHSQHGNLDDADAEWSATPTRGPDKAAAQPAKANDPLGLR